MLLTILLSIPLPRAKCQGSSEPIPPTSSHVDADLDVHLSLNPVYRELVEPKQEAIVRLDPAAVLDGQSAAEQHTSLLRLIEEKYALDRFLSPSVFAPHALRMEREKGSDGWVAMRVAVIFAAEGRLDAISSSRFVNQLVPVDDEAASRELLASELAAAGVELESRDPQREFFHRVRGKLFDRVEFRGVSRSYWTQSEDSILLALQFDARFDSIDELRATWERFERGADGSLQPVEDGVFPGGGLFIKITQLKEPTDRLIVEARMMLVEPLAWFGGSNLIGSKLPPAVQSEVREIRRKVLRESRPH